MRYTMKQYMGKTNFGREVYAHTIQNGDLSITVLDYGAVLQKFIHKGTDIVLGYDRLEDYPARAKISRGMFRSANTRASALRRSMSRTAPRTAAQG